VESEEFEKGLIVWSKYSSTVGCLDPAVSCKKYATIG
jgi:hypothetical protein